MTYAMSYLYRRLIKKEITVCFLPPKTIRVTCYYYDGEKMNIKNIECGEWVGKVHWCRYD